MCPAHLRFLPVYGGGVRTTEGGTAPPMRAIIVISPATWAIFPEYSAPRAHGGIMKRIMLAAAFGVALIALPGLAQNPQTKSYPLKGASIHDVAPAPGGLVWWTAQQRRKARDPRYQDRLNQARSSWARTPPRTASSEARTARPGSPMAARTPSSATIPKTEKVAVFKLPEETGGYTNLNTPTEDGNGNIWFTGQNGWHGKLDVKTGKVSAWKSPKGRGRLWNDHDAGRQCVVRLAGEFLSRADRPRDRQREGHRAARAEPRHQARLERQQGRSLDVGMERRPDFALLAFDREVGPHSSSRWREGATSTPSMSTTRMSSG